MTCEIVAAPAAIAQMLSADRSIRGTVPRRNIITALSVTRHFFWRFYFCYLLSPVESRLHRSSPEPLMFRNSDFLRPQSVVIGNVRKDLNTPSRAAKRIELNKIITD